MFQKMKWSHQHLVTLRVPMCKSGWRDPAWHWNVDLLAWLFFNKLNKMKCCWVLMASLHLLGLCPEVIRDDYGKHQPLGHWSYNVRCVPIQLKKKKTLSANHFLHASLEKTHWWWQATSQPSHSVSILRNIEHFLIGLAIHLKIFFIQPGGLHGKKKS